ncbi:MULTISPECIES: chemotaxis protein CheW [unclassified Sphingopyxis]|jgi:purine-binding chemotaxis protein CheW|uniref:chemotaxis protein CheW n=1 Tax=unclassified Sphingopyxis TaxID=2614943 RepID=UPI000731A839|nr:MULTISPECIES: chemotaxis protein CheW [unclassified Sphingopyxis]KTE27763.1 chemotaxis protein CheW [Sphingopyxis sp. H057]KTE55856.1 chemotaxis protein CheW [Sphingopyxis sp. H073]KTE56498.1 chemotaxis protein CheW [Sphingopyxis sp. H107]KTE57264.1 chemotaxis protein CheW [Sphingopyxis sp. H071]KTE65318.1 chemotaxis protein CheW [Sphingopyxis sp. H100]
MMDKLYLVARIADTRVALRSRAINSVVTVGTPVEVPAAPPHVAGLFALRSRVFTLIDPHVVVGLPSVPVAPGQRVVVVDVAEHGYALLADEIEDVCFIDAPETRVTGKLLPGWARVADAMIEHEGHSLLVVDPSHFITLPAQRAA